MLKPATFDLLDKDLTREESDFLGIADKHRANSARIEFKLDPTYWQRHYPEISRHNYDWKEFKFSDQPNFVNTIPTTDIGIYMIIVKAPNLISFLPQFVMYVGISGENNSNRPLRDRLLDYYRLSQLKKRNKLYRLLGHYYHHCYIKYSLLPGISSNDLEKLEEDFHGFFYPPAGERDFPVDLKQIKQAQWTR